MRIVVDIPESILNTIQADEMISREQLAVLQMHILNGTPLDKIRAEVNGIEINGRVDAHTLFIRGGEEVKQMALEIIDKYKAESEDCG